MRFAAALAVLASVADAHYTMPYLVIGGTATKDWGVTRKTANYQSNGPVTDITSAAFRCYQLADGSEGAAIANVTAGSTIAIGARASFSHPGNFGAWLSKVPEGQNAAAWTGDGATWVKIYNDKPDITAGGISWPTQNKATISFPIPKCIADGQYLLRTEHVALHSAGSAGGAQFYISCHQISVSGGTGTWKPNLQAIPGSLSPTDPGIMINIYYPIPKTYTPWGGAPLEC